MDRDPREGSGANAPVPDELVSRAKAAFRDRVTDGELLPLEFDSLVDDVHGSAADHLLQFSGPLVRVALHVSSTEPSSDLHGHVEPAQPVRIELQGLSPNLVVDSGSGEFSFSGLLHGTVRLRLSGMSNAIELHTDWFRI
jgi:hypothetical protein